MTNDPTGPTFVALYPTERAAIGIPEPTRNPTERRNVKQHDGYERDK